MGVLNALYIVDWGCLLCQIWYYVYNSDIYLKWMFLSGGTIITITGTDFGMSPVPSSPLTLGGQIVTITNYSSTEIVAQLPSHSPGSYPIMLQVGNQGYADLR